MTLDIERIELFLVSMRLKDPFETSFGVERARECIIVKVAGEGLSGWGECVAGSYPGYNAETTGTAWHVLEQFFIPAVLGQKFGDVEQYRRLISHYKGNQLARAGLEMALWDLLGQAQDRSLQEMLGGSRRSVPVGVSVGLQASELSLGEVVDDFLGQGYQRVKLKIKPGVDLNMVAFIRQAHPDLALQVDANSAYTLDDAPVFQAMDEYKLILIEQPLAEDDIIDHRRLQEMVTTPICLDESILHLRHARQAVETKACKIINIKPGRVGGLYEALVIHDYCKGMGIPVWCGGMLETNIGRASNLAIASLPGFLLPGDISASERYYEEDIADPDFVLNEDSTIDVPEGPGLGISVRQKSLEKFTLKHETYRA
jgi:O-succinylbenzoate synthase